METRANYIAVGIFTLLAMLAAGILVYWISGYSNRDQLVPLDVRIEGSVSGLGPGSVVQFNGITVGRVTDLSLDTSDPSFVVVHTEVDANTPVREDTRANVGLRGLSGGAFIALEGGSADKPALLVEAQNSDDDTVPRIQGAPSAFSDLIVRVNSIASQVERTMTVLQAFVNENESRLTDTFENIENFTGALAGNSADIGRFMESAGDVANALEGISGKMDGTITQVEAIVLAIEPDKVRQVVDGAANLANTVSNQEDAIAEMLQQAKRAAERVDKMTVELDETAKRINAIVAAVEPDSVASAVNNVDQAAGQINNVLSRVDAAQVGSAVSDVAALAGEARQVVSAVDHEQVSSLIQNLSEASARLNTLSGAVTSEQVASLTSNIDTAAREAREVLAAVDEEAVSQTISDVSAAARRARQFVSELDPALIRQLITDLSQASASVSRVVSAIDADRLNRAVDNISETAEGANRVVKDVENVTSQFRDRGPDVQKIIDDAVALTERLNKTSEKVDGLVSQAQGLLGAGANEGVMTDIRATLAEFRRSARVISTEISRVSASVSGFTQRGLGDTQGLIRDARQSLDRIDRVIRNIEDNPAALISGAGGSRVPETKGGRPRR
jgi:phospholipid/cholesterol/gamma-HCH transport system substrate-binding protein